MGTEAHTAAALGKGAGSRSQWRAFARLFAFFLVVIGTAAVAAHTIQDFHRHDLRAKITRELTQKAQAFASRLNSDRKTPLADFTSQAAQLAGARATVVDGNGDVLADSQVPLAALQKEGSQPEFVAALRGTVGVRTRSRKPFGVPVLYVAVPLPGGAVRLSTPLAEIEAASAHARELLWRSCAFAVLVAFLISALIARITARP